MQLWFLAIENEIIRNDTFKAKSLFFQAIGHCPWSKDLYMLPFNRLRSAFSEQELQDIIGIMEEKEVRISIPAFFREDE